MNEPGSTFSFVVPVAALAVLSLVGTSCSSGGSSAVAATPPVRTIDLPPLVVQDPWSPVLVDTSTTETTAGTTSGTTEPPPATPVVVTVPVGPSDPIPVIGRRSGEGARMVQQRLLELGFWLQAVNGDYGVTTRQAVMAFQKYRGLEPTESIDEATAEALAEPQTRAHGRADTGTLLEIDKTRQLMFLVIDGRTEWAFNVSTGSGVPYVKRDKNRWGRWVRGDSQTPDGLFRIDRQYEKGWRPGDLGEIYRPKYFNGGIAVHGAYQIPAHPASHGCVRVSTPAMDHLWKTELLPLGTVVWVHSIS